MVKWPQEYMAWGHTKSLQSILHVCHWRKVLLFYTFISHLGMGEKGWSRPMDVEGQEKESKWKQFKVAESVRGGGIEWWGWILTPLCHLSPQWEVSARPELNSAHLWSDRHFYSTDTQSPWQPRVSQLHCLPQKPARHLQQLSASWEKLFSFGYYIFLG